MKQDGYERYDGPETVMICGSCGSQGNPEADPFIMAGHNYGVCKFCKGKTKEIYKSDYEFARDAIRQPGGRANNF